MTTPAPIYIRPPFHGVARNCLAFSQRQSEHKGQMASHLRNDDIAYSWHVHRVCMACCTWRVVYLEERGAGGSGGGPSFRPFRLLLLKRSTRACPAAHSSHEIKAMGSKIRLPSEGVCGVWKAKFCSGCNCCCCCCFCFCCRAFFSLSA